MRKNNTSLYRIISKVLLILVLINTNIVPISVALESCPIGSDLPESGEILSAIDRCMNARKGTGGENPNSITEFVCPGGEFFASNQQPITSETLSYLIAVQLSFNKVDVDIQKYMKQLQKTREADPAKWIEMIRSCTEKMTHTYSNICGFGTLEAKLNEDTDTLHITTTNVYPQTLCTDLASKKIAGWQYLQRILMSDGINKNQTNSTDSWMTQVKGGYARVLGSWHTYQKILARAVSKMTGYTKASN